MRRGVEKMLHFYGLTIDGPAGTPAVVKAQNFSQRAVNWLRPLDHNFLRLTRMMMSLTLLSQESTAAALQRCLEDIYHEHPKVVGKTTIRFWRQAVDAARS